MISFALNIIAFFIVVSFISMILGPVLSFFGFIFSSSNSGDNKSKGLLAPVFKILKISENDSMRLDTPKEDLKEAIKVYYEILRKVFESETPEQKKEILASNTPSGKLSSAFFAATGLGEAINTLTKDISYVMEGSGWVDYKKILSDSVGGELKTMGNKYEIVFDKDFHLVVEEYQGYGYEYGDKEEWRVEGYFRSKECLSYYTSSTPGTPSTFKPDVWILDILKSAKVYSQLLDEYKVKKATKMRESQLFG